ncbi:hypothetical protein BFP97_17235 [Roseivirga sp. 4D4]|uniref:hypothetical protein n=1 Tax=Roseivirga sp. 4D4 TaxID=1889784 RepID=UPI00085309D2|nr:hypothetical protein [Roseivirga sp. 4D4]OEK03158.1 hypothetical protein BFP97_17235 [Roseivirga sp. 4D4]
MKIKIVTRIAFLGLSLVLLAFLLKLFYPIDFNIRSGMLVIGFTLMLLGTIWRVVLEMNDSD